MGETGAAGLTDIFNSDVTDVYLAGDADVYTIQHGIFPLLICCLLSYLYLYYKAMQQNSKFKNTQQFVKLNLERIFA